MERISTRREAARANSNPFAPSAAQWSLAGSAARRFFRLGADQAAERAGAAAWR
jgi:hypothetical protein